MQPGRGRQQPERGGGLSQYPGGRVLEATYVCRHGPLPSRPGHRPRACGGPVYASSPGQPCFSGMAAPCRPSDRTGALGLLRITGDSKR